MSKESIQDFFKYVILQGAKVGKNAKIGHNCVVYPKAEVGSGCNIQCNTDIFTGVILKEDVFVGPSVTFTNDLTPRAYDPKEPGEYVKTIVKKGASIGANATILCGITIGEYSFIGAGSVVVKDVPPREVWCGNPARFLRRARRLSKGVWGV